MTRKIEKELIAAIAARKDWRKDNTAVFFIPASESGNLYGDRSEVFLHSNHIADVWHKDGSVDVDLRTLARWPSVTTKSRLRALGANITTKAFRTYYNGVEVA